ncbi:hypothetical protein DSO57_1002833 [Entomophthora muscae]|uniref:Uncharacterized protein n=1 Tax=Entomophthora muscae TaxID=34485 RepID=A0ACC2RZU6_9FUNG|nr:hypothetical protein DSO57_1002833 [Entomophthora muscae]
MLWIIHGQVNAHIVPFVFFLPNINEETYIHAFTILKQKLDDILPTLDDNSTEKRGLKKKKANPEATHEKQATSKNAPESLPYHATSMVDFEALQAKTFIKVFKIRPQGCFFHY